MYLRSKLPYYRVNTNNYLESYLGKVKEIVHANMSMSESLKELIGMERMRQSDYNYLSNRVGTFVNRNFDREMSTALKFTTHFVADNVAKEYDVGRSKASEYVFVEGEDKVKVQGAKHSRDVTVLTWACTCDFAVAMELLCRHSIAARIHLGMKPVIPLERIGVRWTRLQAPIPSVRQFTYNSYNPKPQHGPSQRSANERYREAMRQLQPLCSEIAEISDDDQFDKAIQFVQDAWMNARMRKRVSDNVERQRSTRKPDSAPEEAPDDESPTNVSNMWCLVRAGVSLTQNSLFSEEIGSVNIVDTRSISLPLPKPVSVLTVSQEQEAEDQDDDDDFEKEDHSDEDDFDESARERPASNIEININPRAKRPGRPEASRAEDESKVRQSRRVFNDTMTGRRSVGEITMMQLVTSLDEEKPVLAELQRRLEPVTVRHAERERSKVELVKKPRSSMVNDAFYILPSNTLDKCFEVFPLSNEAEDAISLYSQSYSQEASEPSAIVEGVKIGSGPKTLFYSRTTIEVMQRVRLLKQAADAGLKFVRWLERDVASAVSSVQQQDVQDLVEQVSSRYPTELISGLDSDYHYGMLPLMKPPEWFNDAVILAFCERLSKDWPIFKVTSVLSFPTADPHKKRTRSTPVTSFKVSAAAEAQIISYYGDEIVRVIAIPICFANTHWCCMIVDKTKHLIKIYDSLVGAHTMNGMGALAEKIEELVSATTFTVQRDQSPVQSDRYSCGFFVCYKIWRQLDAKVSRDLSATGQLSLRFKMIKMIVHGSHDEHAND